MAHFTQELITSSDAIEVIRAMEPQTVLQEKDDFTTLKVELVEKYADQPEFHSYYPAGGHNA